MNICLDTETTGLNPSFDEILQLSIIDSNTNEVLFNDYFKPQYTVCWDEAQAVNGISYDDVSNCKSITQSLAQIQNIIDRADKIYGYNVNFDIAFLEQAGIEVRAELVDVMTEFAEQYGEWNSAFNDSSKKLDREEMNNIFATKFVKLLLDEWFNGFRGEKSIEKEFFEHISRLNSECFKNSLPNNLEDWEKAIINELEGVSKQVASGNIPILQERTKIYIDMDGTIARFHDENLYLERMFEKGFFIDLKPFENAVYAIEQLVNDSTAEIFILSATVNSCSLDEKQKWLDRYLPNIDKEHRIFTSLNVPKSEAIGHRLTDKDILIDDYNKNLLEWQKAGGTSVKAKNNINHKGLHGELWKGELIDVVNGDVYSDICKLANENYYYAYIGENDVEKLKNSGICYHLQMSGDRIIAKVSIAYKPILDNIVNSNRSIKCDTGSTPKM